MARRKSLVAQILADRQRAKEQRERAERQAQAQIMRDYRAEQQAQQKALAAQEREVEARERIARKAAAAATREAERRAVQAQKDETARQRQAEQAAAADVKRQAALERAAAAEVAQQRRAEAEKVKADKERARLDLAESATVQSEGLRERLGELTAVLWARPRQPVVGRAVLQEVLDREGEESFCAQLQAALVTSSYPLGITGQTAVLGYRPEARELIVERELPRLGVVPAEREFRVVKGEVRMVPRKDAEIRHLYGQLLARTALRTLAEVFQATPASLVDSVVLNGRVTAVDKATGKVINPHLLSVQFLREAFEDLNLDEPELDPELCLRAQNALISSHPHDLVPVKPLMYYDLDRYKTIVGKEYLVDLDSRLDLLTLSPNEFETLIRQLFEARGLRAWQTQASRDDGVDAVAVNEDPVLGGVAIIQAKRYARIVGYESITALAGVMHDKAAAKGILVTTSWVGKASRDFAHRNGRIQIIEGRELKQMLTESLNMDVLISLPVVPPGWDRAEIA